jgi:hypothetical protein
MERTRLIIEAMQKRIDEMTPESAREWLYRLGTHNKDGSLTKQYGGEYTDEDHPAHS